MISSINQNETFALTPGVFMLTLALQLTFMLGFMPMFTLAPPISIFMLAPPMPMLTFPPMAMLLFISQPMLPFMPVFMFTFIPTPPMPMFMFIPLELVLVVVEVIWYSIPGCMQTGEGAVLLMIMVLPLLRSAAVLPAARNPLHSTMAFGAQQMLPSHKQLQPSPSHAQIWQQTGSSNLRSSGLQSHQEQMRLASWQPPQQTPQQLSHQHPQIIH